VRRRVEQAAQERGLFVELGLLLHLPLGEVEVLDPPLAPAGVVKEHLVGLAAEEEERVHGAQGRHLVLVR
jgi:hypothetical protein